MPIFTFRFVCLLNVTRDNQRTIILIGALVIGLGIGQSLSNSFAPNQNPPDRPRPRWHSGPPLDGNTVQLGFIVPYTESIQYYTPFVEDIIMSDMNEYAQKLDYDVEFEILIDDSAGQAAIHLEKVQGFKSMNMGCLIGGFLEKQAHASLAYVNDNDMCLVSPSSRYGFLSIQDSLFRLSPPLMAQKTVLKKVIDAKSLNSVILIQEQTMEYQNDYPIILDQIGVSMVDEIQYYAEYPSNTTIELISKAPRKNVGIHLTSSNILREILEDIEDYPDLYNYTWILTDTPVDVNQLSTDFSDELKRLDLTIITLAPVWSEQYFSVKDRFTNLVDTSFDYHKACTYDASYMMMFGILQTQNSDGSLVRTLFPALSDQFFGASGWTKVDENGDRKYSDYIVYSFIDTGDSCEVFISGKYDGISDRFYWFE